MLKVFDFEWSSSSKKSIYKWLIKKIGYYSIIFDAWLEIIHTKIFKKRRDLRSLELKKKSLKIINPRWFTPINKSKQSLILPKLSIIRRKQSSHLKQSQNLKNNKLLRLKIQIKELQFVTKSINILQKDQF